MEETRIYKCRICSKSDLKVVLDFGLVALADSFIKESEIPYEKKFPLRLCYCNDCYHIQIDDIINPSELFENYVWETGISASISGFAEELYSSVIECFGRSNPDVLEIACNDGTILSTFKNKGCNVMGVDPAKNIVELAIRRGIKAIPKFFNFDTAKEIYSEFGKKDVIIARNVIAHVSDLHGLVKGVKLLLSQSGFAVFEFPQLKTTYNELQYDQVFHEHIGYHSLDSVIKLFKLYDLVVFDAKEIWIHGGSLRVFVQHSNGPKNITDRVVSLHDKEIELGLLELSSWVSFGVKAIAHRSLLRNTLLRLKSEGNRIIVYGASGKGQSLLQFCGIDSSLVDCVIDKSKLKHGKFTPGTHIPIYDTDYIVKSGANVILLCAWNFAFEIMKQEAFFIENGGKFLHPIPEPHFLN